MSLLIYHIPATSTLVIANPNPKRRMCFIHTLDCIFPRVLSSRKQDKITTDLVLMFCSPPDGSTIAGPISQHKELAAIELQQESKQITLFVNNEVLSFQGPSLCSTVTQVKPLTKVLLSL